jgi:hypothetical protein
VPRVGELAARSSTKLATEPSVSSGLQSCSETRTALQPSRVKKKTLHFIWSYHERPCCSCNCAPRRSLGAHSLQFSKSYIYEECVGSLSTNFKEANYLLFTFGKQGLITMLFKVWTKTNWTSITQTGGFPQRKGCFSYWLLLSTRVQRFIRISSHFFLFSFLKNAGVK